VEVDGVHQRPVDVEDHGLDHVAAPARLEARGGADAPGRELSNGCGGDAFRAQGARKTTTPLVTFRKAGLGNIIA
jgi:hypothetical protein